MDFSAKARWSCVRQTLLQTPLSISPSTPTSISPMLSKDPSAHISSFSPLGIDFGCAGWRLGSRQDGALSGKGSINGAGRYAVLSQSNHHISGILASMLFARQRSVANAVFGWPDSNTRNGKNNQPRLLRHFMRLHTSSWLKHAVFQQEALTCLSRYVSDLPVFVASVLLGKPMLPQVSV